MLAVCPLAPHSVRPALPAGSSVGVNNILAYLVGLVLGSCAARPGVFNVRRARTGRAAGGARRTPVRRCLADEPAVRGFGHKQFSPSSLIWSVYQFGQHYGMPRWLSARQRHCVPVHFQTTSSLLCVDLGRSWIGLAHQRQSQQHICTVCCCCTIYRSSLLLSVRMCRLMSPRSSKSQMYSVSPPAAILKITLSSRRRHVLPSFAPRIM